MADYKELLRKAIAALPENNGASRRAVYEKARSALVGQLRAIQPPLAARDITTHRLQLEDGIRQVEQEASEAAIAKLDHGDSDEPAAKTVAARPATNGSTPPAPAKPASIEGIIASDRAGTARPKTTLRTEPTISADSAPRPEPVAKAEPKTAPPKPVVVAKNDAKDPPRDEARPEDKTTSKNGRPLPSIVARAEAAKGRTGTTAFGVPSDKPAFDGRNDNSRRAPSIEPRRDVAASSTRIEPTALRGQAVARQTVVDPIDFAPPQVSAAMSTVREVEVEPVLTADPQGAIDRAIATLDREARGETTQDELNGADIDLKAEPTFEPVSKAKTKKSFPDPVRPKKQPREREPRERTERSPFVADSAGFQRPQGDTDRGGISALTIFLFVFVILLAGVGGAGFWAWREGYVDLDALFASNQPAVVATNTTATDAAPAAALPADTAAVTGPGNTATSTDVAPVPDPAVPTANEALLVDDRLTASPDASVAPPEVVEPLALRPTDAQAATTEERLPSDTATGTPQTAEEAIAAVNPANIAGSQSLLLEAADDGTTSAIPFSGTVEWSKGTDEMGLPTLVGRANIPARNMGVELLIRKNSDPTLPASHLMEINFSVSETFIGGSVAGLPGVLLKNEELVQGSPLIGASARVVGNSFLFALSASPEDSATNNALITGRKWMDIAIIYATGKRAIITLEKDQAAQDLFTEVFAAWNATASAT